MCVEFDELAKSRENTEENLGEGFILLFDDDDDDFLIISVQF